MPNGPLYTTGTGAGYSLMQDAEQVVGGEAAAIAAAMAATAETAARLKVLRTLAPFVRGRSEPEPPSSRNRRIPL
jgi:hypothetical protein